MAGLIGIQEDERRLSFASCLIKRKHVAGRPRSDDRELSIRDAEKLTGVSHSEFSRIRNTQLRRFTLDRMIAILGKLDEDVEVTITFRPRRHGAELTPMQKMQL